jgi:hypothetical protein
VLRTTCIIVAMIFLIVVGCYTRTVQYGVASHHKEQTGDTHELMYDEYTVGVTRIEAQSRVSTGDSLSIRVWAHLGPNLCCKFSRFEVKWNHDVANVSVIGRRPRPTEPIACPAMPSELQGDVLILRPPAVFDVVKVVFRRYGGGEIVHVVRVTN